MKEFKFILKKGDMLSFSKKGYNSGCVFDLSKDIIFHVTAFENGESIYDSTWETNGEYSLFKFYCDEIKLNSHLVLNLRRLLELGVSKFEIEGVVADE